MERELKEKVKEVLVIQQKINKLQKEIRNLKKVQEQLLRKK